MKTITKIQKSFSANISKKRVAAYIRVSHSSLESSYSNQVSTYNNIIQSNMEWEFAGIYSDFAISGKSQKNRPEFQRLLEDCRQGKIDIILTKSISRFGRNTLDVLQSIRELKQLGISVRFERESIDSLSTDGELLLTLLASIAQEESTSISQNLKWKVKERFKQGLPFIPQDIYGYRWNGVEYEIEEHEASIVRQVFSWYLDGVGVPTIAKRLNELGEKTKLGNAFTKNILYEFFKQEAYYGRLVLQKTYREEFGHSPKRNTGQRTKYIVDNAHEPIISKEIFDSANLQKSSRLASNHYRGDYTDSLFVDKVYCDHCGQKMSISKEKQFGFRFSCVTRIRKGRSACPSKTLAERRIIRTLDTEQDLALCKDWVDSQIDGIRFNTERNCIDVIFKDEKCKSYPIKRGQIK